MATRMQQRRGTASQWTTANPILAAGEIGFETDTSKFKIGDSVNTWDDLEYFTSAAEIANIIDGAPDLLNTLNELAAAVNDDPTFFTTVATNLSNHEADTMGIHGIVDTSALATKTYADTAVSTHNSDTTNVHGIDNTNDLATRTYADTAVSTHNSDTTSVHGIADTSLLAIASTVATDISSAVSTHNADTTNVHGIADTAVLVIQTDLSNAVSTHNSDTTNVHGISDTSLLAIASTVATDIASAVSSHNSDTTNIHGITDTAELATKSYADSAEADAITAAGTAADTKISTAIAALTKSSVGLTNVDNTSDANKPVSTATQTALDLKAPLADPTFTGTVSGVTKSHVGLANVDNTSDADKPVSTATQTALDAKASLAGAVFTANVEVDGNLVVDGDFTVNGTNFSASATSITIEDNLVQLAHQNAANTVDLGIVVGYNDGAAKHSGIVRDVSADKWKLFKGVTTEPSTTVDFTEGSLDALQVGALEATTVTPSSGIVFSDGTQTKEGVVSRTPIIQKTSSYTLSALTERDSLIEISSSSGTTLTIPTDATLNFPIGTSLDILQTSTGQVTIAGDSGVTVNSTPGLKLRTTWSSATLFKRAADTWVVYGDLTA